MLARIKYKPIISNYFNYTNTNNFASLYCIACYNKLASKI